MQSVKCKATSRAGLSRASGSSGSGARLHRLHSGPAGRHSGSARDQDWAGKSETKLSVGATILQCQLGLAEMTDIVPGQWQCLSDGQNMTWGARGSAVNIKHTRKTSLNINSSSFQHLLTFFFNLFPWWYEYLKILVFQFWHLGVNLEMALMSLLMWLLRLFKMGVHLHAVVCGCERLKFDLFHFCDSSLFTLLGFLINKTYRCLKIIYIFGWLKFQLCLQNNLEPSPCQAASGWVGPACFAPKIWNAGWWCWLVFSLCQN